MSARCRCASTLCSRAAAAPRNRGLDVLIASAKRPFEFSSFQTWCLSSSASRTSPSGNQFSGNLLASLSVVGFALTH